MRSADGGLHEVLVVVVAYRADEHLRACLAGVAQAYPVVVVDNDADAGSDRVRSIVERAGAVYVSAERNLGFAGGVNLALAHAWDQRSDVLLLNPDARIDSDQIEVLAAALHEVAHRAAVGPQLVRPDGVEERASWPMPSPSQVWLDALGLGRYWRGRRFVTGAALMLRGDALRALGALDERYFLYSEEADWQMRALRTGWSVAVVPDVRVVHQGGASSSDPRLRARQFHTSGQVFARRWYGRRGSAVMRAGRVVAALRRSVTSPHSRVEQRELLRVCLHPHPEDPA